MVTGGIGFLRFTGAELLIEIARFWSSIATWDQDQDRYEIHGVMGPDEYHEGYPGSDEQGLRNNTYTNVMAVWVLQRALEALAELPPHYRQELVEELTLRDEELDRWRDITRKMKVVFHADGVLTQFEGYEQLLEFDWEGYRERYGNIQRLDRVLEAEGDSTDRYKLAKQADVLMLLFLLSREELRELLADLGYEVSEEQLARTVGYHLERTSHGSTLSGVVSAWVLARYQPEQAWQFLLRALESDVADVQGGTTAEGIHLGAMAGTVDIVLRCLTGMRARGAGAPVRAGPAAAGQAAPVQRPLPGPPHRRHLCRRPHGGQLPPRRRPTHQGPGLRPDGRAGPRRQPRVPLEAPLVALQIPQRPETEVLDAAGRVPRFRLHRRGPVQRR